MEDNTPHPALRLSDTSVGGSLSSLQDLGHSGPLMIGNMPYLPGPVHTTHAHTAVSHDIRRGVRVR